MAATSRRRGVAWPARPSRSAWRRTVGWRRPAGWGRVRRWHELVLGPSEVAGQVDFEAGNVADQVDGHRESDFDGVGSGGEDERLGRRKKRRQGAEPHSPTVPLPLACVSRFSPPLRGPPAGPNRCRRDEPNRLTPGLRVDTSSKPCFQQGYDRQTTRQKGRPRHVKRTDRHLRRPTARVDRAPTPLSGQVRLLVKRRHACYVIAVDSPGLPIIKTLFALSCNICAFPGCEERLTDPAWRETKADVAHIRGKKPGHRAMTRT
jgi:hypothetical protein